MLQQLCRVATVEHAGELLLVVGVDCQVNEGVDDVIDQIKGLGESRDVKYIVFEYMTITK